MIDLSSFEVILWDFDGVILDSMPVRTLGFSMTLSEYDDKDVQKLIDYHTENGGLSRYHKYRYFYEKILNKEVSDDQIADLAGRFSSIMKRELCNKNLLIEDSLLYISSNFQKHQFHVVSGSDEVELKFLNKELGIAKYFKSINGSPTPKTKIVSNLLAENNWRTDKVCLIGDSKNDFDAAVNNGVSFFGYNNIELKEIPNTRYIAHF